MARFAELGASRCKARHLQLLVCVVDIVHGSEHDISRGATAFWELQIGAGRVAASRPTM